MTRALLLVLALAPFASALEVPPLEGRVNDRAGLLSSAVRDQVSAKLRAYEERTGHQVAVLTIPSLEGEVLESYSLKVSRAWGLGRKGASDGVLLLIAKNDRKLRIEVGHGLEGNLPDALAGRIIREVVSPKFKAGDFEGGVSSGVDAILAASQGTYASPPPSRAYPFGARKFGDLLHMFLGGGFLILIALYADLEGLLDPNGGWGRFFILTLLWGVVAFPLHYWPLQVLFLVRLVAFPLLKFLIPRTAFGRKIHARGKKIYFGNWVMFDSSSGGGSSGGGGDFFSGGGGDFGGGGASGDW